MIDPEVTGVDDESSAETSDLADSETAAADAVEDGAAVDVDNDDVVDVDEADAEVDPLAVAESERDGFLDDLRRMTADFANFRKQVDKRSADVRANAAVNLVTKLLPVLDACDAAVLQGAIDVEPIRAMLRDTLEKEGLEVHDPDGEVFDPEQHEAVMTEEGNGSEPIVSEVLRTGYAWNGRVIRPAMVKVRG